MTDFAMHDPRESTDDVEWMGGNSNLLQNRIINMQNSTRCTRRARCIGYDRLPTQWLCRVLGASRAYDRADEPLAQSLPQGAPGAAGRRRCSGTG